MGRNRAHAGRSLERREQKNFLGVEVHFHLLAKVCEGARGGRPVAALSALLGRNKKIVAMAMMIGKNLRGKVHGSVLKWWVPKTKRTWRCCEVLDLMVVHA
jgi:hypothetical protein